MKLTKPQRDALLLILWWAENEGSYDERKLIDAAATVRKLAKLPREKEMTIPESTLRALAPLHELVQVWTDPRKLGSKVKFDKTGNLIVSTRQSCADELAAILRQIEAAPSPPDSSQGEPFAWMIGTNIYAAAELGAGGQDVKSHPNAIPLYTHPSSPQVAVADDKLLQLAIERLRRLVTTNEQSDALQVLINAAPQSAPKAADPQWQPIETAPKNTPILCWWGLIGNRGNSGSATRIVDNDGQEFWVSNFDSAVMLFAPNAWQPLPAPPRSLAQAEGDK